MKKNNSLDYEQIIKDIVDSASEEKINSITEMKNVTTLIQSRLYGKYNYDWSNMTIEQKTPHGWLRGIYALTETIVLGRWKYWLDIRTLAATNREACKKFLEETEIPRISFNSNNIVMSMLNKCIDNPYLRSLYKSDILALFTEWLLYGFGDNTVTELPKGITSQANEYWYKEFKGELLILYPDDYLGTMAAELGLGKNQGYFPTPMHVVTLMAEMAMSGDKDNRKYESVNDPCLGSGRMLLCASNYSLDLSGQDINPNIINVSKVNGYLYVPWMVESDDNINNIITELRIEKLNKK